MKVKIEFLGIDGETWATSCHSGSYEDLAEARRAARNAARRGGFAYRVVPPEAPKERRNRLQRAKRASPEAKAKEARATRRSYWRRKGDWRPECCGSCRELTEKHDL